MMRRLRHITTYGSHDQAARGNKLPEVPLQSSKSIEYNMATARQNVSPP